MLDERLPRTYEIMPPTGPSFLRVGEFNEHLRDHRPHPTVTSLNGEVEFFDPDCLVVDLNEAGDANTQRGPFAVWADRAATRVITPPGELRLLLPEIQDADGLPMYAPQEETCTMSIQVYFRETPRIPRGPDDWI